MTKKPTPIPWAPDDSPIYQEGLTVCLNYQRLRATKKPSTPPASGGDANPDDPGDTPSNDDETKAQ